MALLKIYMGFWVGHMPGLSGPRQTKIKDHGKEIPVKRHVDGPSKEDPVQKGTQQYGRQITYPVNTSQPLCPAISLLVK